jgi:hypothetical protein
MPDVVEIINTAERSVEVLDNSGAVVEVLVSAERLIEVITEGPQGPQPSVPASIHYIFDGGGLVLGTGLKGSVILPFACTINSWTLVAEPSGSIVVDIWRTTLAAYPPEVADSITGSAKPTISGGQSATSSTLTGWGTSLAEGDVLAFRVDSVTSITLASIALKVTRA